MREGTTSCSPGATMSRAPVVSRARMTLTISSEVTPPRVMTTSTRSERTTSRRRPKAISPAGMRERSVLVGRYPTTRNPSPG